MVFWGEKNISCRWTSIQSIKLHCIKRWISFYQRTKAHSSPNAKVFSEVDMILKKFEVSKRIYDFYLPKFKKSDESDFRTFHNYLHFARILSVSYGITKKLNYLNGMLKVIDSLISVFNELSEKEKKNLAWLAEKELNHIRELTINLGIEE